MSYLFDALRKAEAEQSGTDLRDLPPAELQQFAERKVAARREATVQSAEVPVDARTELSSVLQPVVHPLEREIEGEGINPAPELAIEEKQRDEVMKFVQNVFLLQGAEAPRTIVLIGIEPGDGCSWICCRSAELLASQVKGPICIVDANLRSPGLHKTFGVGNHHGLSDALEATTSIHAFVNPLSGQNLWLLSCGANAADRLRLLGSDRMRLRLSELRRYFAYILVDSPALSLGNDAIVLGRAADGVVLVLKANSCHREAARNAVQDLHNAGVRILGAILNQRTFPIPQAIYNRL